MNLDLDQLPLAKLYEMQEVPGVNEEIARRRDMFKWEVETLPEGELTTPEMRAEMKRMRREAYFQKQGIETYEKEKKFLRMSKVEWQILLVAILMILAMVFMLSTKWSWDGITVIH